MICALETRLRCLPTALARLQPGDSFDVLLPIEDTKARRKHYVRCSDAAREVWGQGFYTLTTIGNEVRITRLAEPRPDR